MKNSNEDFLVSLDLIDQEMEDYIPYVLQDLWELGSIPEYIYRLIDKNIDKKEINKIIDFGCGKGAVLIYLAERLDFQGTGIDIVSEFIESGIQHAIEKSVNNKINFKSGNLVEYVDKAGKNDVVIYGYDSCILGDVYETIQHLENCIQDSGYLILEIAFTPDSKDIIEGLPNKKELDEQLEKCCLKVLDKIFWEIDNVIMINKKNNIFINKRVQELVVKYPTKKHLFEHYRDNQIEECRLIEHEMICSTWILKK
jgi:SAM-dependent methyltransferase